MDAANCQQESLLQLESTQVKGQDEILKYHRVEGKLAKTIESDRITCMKISEESLVYGTEEGSVHIMSLTGEILKSFPREHDRAVNDVAIDDSGKMTLSCSDNGNVVLHYFGEDVGREKTYNQIESIKCVCIEDSTIAKRDYDIIFGGLSGKLWFFRLNRLEAVKQTLLFNGADSPVSAIAWRGNVIAWADSNQVRLMDISTMTAICYVNSPVGVSSLNPYPCKLFWESNSDLLIGWADNFRHLELQTVYTSEVESSDQRERGYSKSVTRADWNADVIICGISSFDENHVILLGYVPPLADEEDGGDYPEVQLANKITGDLLSIDSLPLLGNKPRGPWSYHLVSNYSCSSRRQNYHNWNVIRSRTTRGGHRGLCPTCFMSSGQDFLAIRVRDINDRVHAALEMGDLKLAVCLAFSDRTSLRQYQLHDLMTLYLEDLLDKGRADIAAEECHVLIGKDAINWERWIYHFITRKHVAEIVQYIPTSSPRLPPQVYETVLEELLQNDSRLFLDTVKRWAPVSPPLFQNDFMLLRLETVQNPDKCILQAKAELYILARMYDKAITAYLEVEGDRIAKDRSSGDKENPGDFAHIFDMIERENLFNSVRDKLVNMFRLSREHTEQFLLRNIDKLPVKSVVKQLRIDRRCLYWYLHFIFTHCYDTYNTQEFEDYHIMQVSLYAEFSHTGTRAENYAHENCDRVPRLCSHEGVVSGYELALNRNTEENGFLSFLKKSSYVPLPLALEECGKRRPPLYREMVYIYARMNEKREALGLLLREIGSAYDAIKFVESQDRRLWPDLIEYSLRNAEFLGQLLDYLGVCNLDPFEIVSKIPPKLKIPYIHKKLEQIVSQYQFQLFLHDICNDILEFDALNLLGGLNQGQRRALKVIPQQLQHCRLCTRPLYVEAGALRTDAHSITRLKELDRGMLHIKGANVPALLAKTGVIVYSNGTSFHRTCFEQFYCTVGVDEEKIPEPPGDIEDGGASI